MRHLSYITACLLSGALFTACSNLEETGCPSCGDSQETVAQPYSVSFRLGGSVSPATRAASVTQTDEEKALTSLYAVVFADTDAASTMKDGTENQAVDNDLFVAAISVSLDNYNSGSAAEPNLSFVLGEQGHYNICFIANPSEQLTAAITGLTKGVSKVSDFEALKEETAPALTNFLMTSPYYAVTTVYSKQATIAQVALTRAVARIDVLNQADGITVKQLVFHNYGAKSRLIAADTPAEAFDGTCIETEKLYTPADGLEGDSQSAVEGGKNYYGKQIYTYEQYAASGTDAADEEASRPTLEIIYSVPSSGQWFTHTVKFETDPDAAVVPLKRNNHYLVTLSNRNGQIEFTLGVKDWDKGDTFGKPSSDFAQGTDNL